MFRPEFFALYFIVWAMLGIATFILYRLRRDPGFRLRWHARISLFSGLIIFAMMGLLCPDWHARFIIGAAGALILYLSIARTTICRSCGRIIQPIALFQRAKHCPICGGETARSKIFSV